MLGKRGIKRELFILFLISFTIFLVSGIDAAFVDNSSLQQIAYDCGILNTTNAVYTLNQSVNTNGTCFNITANNITLNGKWFSIIGADIDNTENYGIYANGLTNITVINFTSISTFGWIVLAGAGIRFEDVNNSAIININSSNNFYGVHLLSSYNNTLINIGANSNLLGIRISSSSKNALTNVSTSSNSYGIRLDSNSNNNTFTNLDSYSNTYQEIFSPDWSSSLKNRLIYNNSFGEIKFAFLTSNVEGDVRFGNSRNIEINNNSAYVNSISLPALNISANITLDNIGERGFNSPVVLRDGVQCVDCYNFTNLNASTVIFNVSSWSNYSIGEGVSPYDVTSCRELNVAGATYTLRANITGINGDCIRIANDNIVLDGNGHTITGSGYDGYGIYSNGTAGKTYVSNITIKNFKRINGFLVGIYWASVINSFVINNTITTNTINGYGIYLQNFFTIHSDNNVFLSNTISSSVTGILLYEGDNSSFKNNNFNSNIIGIDIGSSYNHQIVNNTFYLNSYAISIGDSMSSGNVLLNNNISRSAILALNLGGIGPSDLIYNNSFGEIKWTNTDFLQNMVVNGTFSFPGNIKIENNSVYFNPSAFTGSINSSANVTLIGIATNFSQPVILRDGINTCNLTTSPSCYNFTSLNAGTVIFNVSSWSNYSIGETYVAISPLGGIQFVSPTDSNGTINRSNILVNVSVNFTNFANVTIKLFNSSMGLISNVTSTSSIFYNNFTSLSDGVYYFNATAYNSSSWSNSTETRTVTINTTVAENPVTPVTGSPGGGGGGSTQKMSLKIQIERLINVNNSGEVEIPFILENDGQRTFSEINITAYVIRNYTVLKKAVISINKTSFSSLNSGKKEAVLLKVYVDETDPTSYEVIINVTSKIPYYNTNSKVSVNFAGKDAIGVIQTIAFTEDLIKEHPECIELEDMVKDARNDFQNGNTDEAVRKANLAVEVCKKYLEESEKVPYLKKQMNKLLIYIVGATLLAIILGALFNFYKYLKIRKIRRLILRGEGN